MMRRARAQDIVHGTLHDYACLARCAYIRANIAMPEQSPYSILETHEHSPDARLWHKGVQTLSTVEALALVIGSVRGVDALAKAQEIIAVAGSESRLASPDAQTLSIVHGLGPRQAERVVAAFELGRRAKIKRLDPARRKREPRDVAERFIPLMRDLAHEEFWAVHLNRANLIIRHVVISIGGISASIVDPHEVFQETSLDRASTVILLHNHPSSNPEPSREAIAPTKSLVDAGRALQLPVQDHIIVAGSQVTILKGGGCCDRCRLPVAFHCGEGRESDRENGSSG